MRTYYRSKRHRIIGGVCGGLGAYTGIDPVFWRILAFFIPYAIPAYIILWACSKTDPNEITL